MQKTSLTKVRVGQDPEFKTSKAGKGYVTFSVASNDYDYTQKEDVPTWYEIFLSEGSFLYNKAKYLKKGTLLNVWGVLKLERPSSWVSIVNKEPVANAKYEFSQVTDIEFISDFKTKAEMVESGGTDLSKEMEDLFD